MIRYSIVGVQKTGASHLGSLRLSLFKKQTDSLRTSFWRLCQPSRARKRHAMDAYRTKNDKCCRNCVQEMIRRNEFRISGSDTSVARIALSGCQTRFGASPSQCLFLSDKGPICVFPTLPGIATIDTKWEAVQCPLLKPRWLSLTCRRRFVIAHTGATPTYRFLLGACDL